MFQVGLYLPGAVLSISVALHKQAEAVWLDYVGSKNDWAKNAPVSREIKEISPSLPNIFRY